MPSTGRYASLKMKTSSAPHHTTIGNRESRQMLTAERRLCGHPDIGPMGVRDQSVVAMSRPASPPAVMTASMPVRDRLRPDRPVPLISGEVAPRTAAA